MTMHINGVPVTVTTFATVMTVCIGTAPQACVVSGEDHLDVAERVLVQIARLKAAA